jgi:hypothetical protein
MNITLLRLLAAAVTVATLTSCATSRNDGGVVGSGNRPDCEPRMRSDGTPAPLPEECRHAREAR